MQLILGAGCAGLSLAGALLDAGVDDDLVLVDRRSAHEHDRTWCFWGGDAAEGVAPVHHRWHRWRFVGRDGAVVEQSSDRHPYVQVRADDFYAATLGRVRAAPNAQLRLSERVASVTERPDGRVAVRTSSGELVADRVVDAMGGAGPLSGGRPAGAIELKQSFLGLEIEASEPVFDPAVATLMDFRTGPGAAREARLPRPWGSRPEHEDGGLHFIYVLPTSPTRALVEHTTLGPRTLAPGMRRLAIATYLREHVGVDTFTAVREERGVLPMTTHAFPLAHGPRIDVVGAAAGAVRPSSGYAFVRIQRQVRALAQAIVDGTAPPARLGPPRGPVLDQLFLRALAVDPPSFDRSLLALAAGTSGDAFARFMNDASTVRDEAAVMAALARPGFLWPMAASSLLRPIAR